MRIAIAVLAIVACLFGIMLSARFGFSRLLGRGALLANSLPAADAAVRLSPLDPEAHRVRAMVLNRLQNPLEASTALESATSLRHRDDYLWLELGSAREEVGNLSGALAALDQAVYWAPYYAHTHWQRGNLLLRMGRRAEAFVELRTAATANPKYLPNLIDLAWGVAREDVRVTEQLITIKDEQERRAFVWFLARKGKGKEAVDQLLSMPTQLTTKDKDELVRLLIASKSFREAFELWVDSYDPAKVPVPAIFNGGFEQPLMLDKTGFSWIVSPEQTKNKLAIDVSEKLSGEKSLQISLDGNWDPGTPLLSQTFLVDPAQNYRVSFGLLTKNLATGGPPVITVSDATTDRLFGKSDSFPATNSWITLSFEFTTLQTSEAAVIRLQRNNCDSAPCPIFGVLWLDEIRIEQTKPTTKH
jgi:tetratricopeptide (TPR) repeat protein